MVTNNFSINLAKIRMAVCNMAVSLQKQPESVSDTGNPYHVAVL